MQGMSKSQLKQVKLALYDKRVLPTPPHGPNREGGLRPPNRLIAELVGTLRRGLLRARTGVFACVC